MPRRQARVVVQCLSLHERKLEQNIVRLLRHGGLHLWNESRELLTEQTMNKHLAIGGKSLAN